LNSRDLENKTYTIKQLCHTELLQKTSSLSGNFLHLSIQFLKTVKINWQSNILVHLLFIIISICKALLSTDF